MIHKEEKKIGKTYYMSHSYDLDDKESYNRFQEYQIIDNIKFEISKDFSEKMENNDIHVKVVEVTGYDQKDGEDDYEIRCYLTNGTIEFIKRNINIGHTNQITDPLYGNNIFVALDYVVSHFERYEDQLILSDEAMEIYSQLLNKIMEMYSQLFKEIMVVGKHAI